MKREEMLIEADELLNRLGDPNLRIYDATILFFRKESELTEFEQYSQGHIPGAAFFDHKQFSDATSKYMYMVPPQETLAAEIGAIGISAESEVIFYTTDMLPCATRAWWLLRYAGHNNVRVLNGGLTSWKDAGGALESGVRQYEQASFVCNLRSEMFVGKEAVLASIEDSQVCAVNTLSQQNYDEGHITGSTLLSCMDLMHDMRAFLPTAQIANRLQEETQYQRVITYCGGGIAATVNAMAHLMAGSSNVAVYDGSMDEWTKEGLPITTSASPSPTSSQER